MSVHSEIQNFYHNKSGDASISIVSRSGDRETGNSHFDMHPSKSKTPEEILLQKGQARARTEFLKNYFEILSANLSPDELHFLKLKIKTKKPAKLLACWCGLKIATVYKNIREKLSDRVEEIEELIDESEWENAELFAKTFLQSLKELSQDEEILGSAYYDPQGDFDELSRAREYLALRERIMTIQEERHRIYSRGFEAGKRKKDIWKKYESLILIGITQFSSIQELLEMGADLEIIKGTIKNGVEFFEKRRSEE